MIAIALRPAQQFANEGMLVAECQYSGCFVVDRAPMNAGVKLNSRYQLLSADQTECRLFRSAKQALFALNGLRSATENYALASYWR